jgi:hypothetical protein
MSILVKSIYLKDNEKKVCKLNIMSYLYVKQAKDNYPQVLERNI